MIYIYKIKMIECEVCGKIFTNSAKGYKADYYFKTHKKNCFRIFKKKQKQAIKEWVNNEATELQINRVYEFIKHQKELIYSEEFEPKRIRTPSPEPIFKPQPILDLEDLERPASNESINSNASSVYEDWRYENQNYLVNQRNEVYDEYDNKLGMRTKNNWSGDFELILE